MIKRIIITSVILVLLVGCTEEVAQENPNAPPEFPHVFMGNAFVDGYPIKEGIVIYAKFGNSQSEIVETLNGRYLNVLVAPKNTSETKGLVTFYLESIDGNTEKATETFQLKKAREPIIVTMELNFSSYP